MRSLVLLLTVLFSLNAFSYVKPIKNWNSELTISEEVAFNKIYDFYIFDTWWEDEGYECGGDFSDLALTKVEGENFVVEGYVTVAMNYCAYTDKAYFQVEFKKVDDSYKMNELFYEQWETEK